MEGCSTAALPTESSELQAALQPGGLGALLQMLLAAQHAAVSLPAAKAPGVADATADAAAVVTAALTAAVVPAAAVEDAPGTSIAGLKVRHCTL